MRDSEETPSSQQYGRQNSQQQGAPLDPSLSNNTTVVNDGYGRPSHDNTQQMHLVDSQQQAHQGLGSKIGGLLHGGSKQGGSKIEADARQNTARSDDSNSDNDNEHNPLLQRRMEDGTSMKHAYLNPVFYRDQPKLWIPRDRHGLSTEQVSSARGHGVDITDEDATIDEKAKVEIQRDTLPGQGFDP
jgi:hypothetical protein